MDENVFEKTQAKLPTKYYGELTIVVFKGKDGKEHSALIKGEIGGKEKVLTRLHSECLTGDTFHSLKCDCGEQLEHSLHAINEKGEGVVLYLRQEGRGIGLFNKIKAYKLQENGMDTVDANLHLGFGDDERDYSIAASMLKCLEVKSVELITNNPKKIEGLEKEGVKVVSRKPSKIKANEVNKEYLSTKREKMGHMLEP